MIDRLIKIKNHLVDLVQNLQHQMQGERNIADSSITPPAVYRYLMKDFDQKLQILRGTSLNKERYLEEFDELMALHFESIILVRKKFKLSSSMEFNSNISQEDKYLFFGVLFNHLKVVATYLAAKADYNAVVLTEPHHQSILQYAIQDEHQAIIELFIKNLPTENLEENLSAIWSNIIELNQWHMLEDLINYLEQTEISRQTIRSSLSKRDTHGNTLLHYAVAAKQPATLSCLLGAGADPSLLNREGKTAFEIAEEQNDQESLIEFEKINFDPHRFIIKDAPDEVLIHIIKLGLETCEDLSSLFDFMQNIACTNWHFNLIAQDNDLINYLNIKIETLPIPKTLLSKVPAILWSAAEVMDRIAEIEIASAMGSTSILDENTQSVLIKKLKLYRNLLTQLDKLHVNKLHLAQLMESAIAKNCLTILNILLEEDISFNDPEQASVFIRVAIKTKNPIIINKCFDHAYAIASNFVEKENLLKLYENCLREIASIPFTPATRKVDTFSLFKELLSNYRHLLIALQPDNQSSIFSKILGALLSTSAQNNSRIAVYLLQYFETVPKCIGFKALTAAAKNGEVTLLKLLIEKGAPLRAPNGVSGSAIGLAIKFKQYECVELLLLAGATRNWKTEDETIIRMFSNHAMLDSVIRQEKIASTPLYVKMVAQIKKMLTNNLSLDPAVTYRICARHDCLQRYIQAHKNLDSKFKTPKSKLYTLIFELLINHINMDSVQLQEKLIIKLQNWMTAHSKNPIEVLHTESLREKTNQFFGTSNKLSLQNLLRDFFDNDADFYPRLCNKLATQAKEIGLEFKFVI